jgi:hypothetical protein
MNIDDDTTLDTTPDSEELDIAAGLADIASDLFGQGNDVESPTPSDGEDATSGVLPTGTDGAPPQTTSEEAKGGDEQSLVEGAVTPSAPSTWSKEAAAEWGEIKPHIQAEILKREQDIFAGLEQYKSRAEIGDRYEGVIAEFRPILEAEQIDPVEMFGNFAANHYLLSRGTPEQKLTIATNLMAHYGIDIEQVQQRLFNAPEVNPEVEELKAKIAQLEAGVNTITSRETAQTRQAFAQQIETFASDPAHPYFDEVSNDIATFLKTGVSKTLEEAYDKAVYANPVTRQKEIDRLTAEKVTTVTAQAKTNADKKARLQASNVTTIPKSANGTVPVGSMDDTLAATLAAIEARG